MAIEPLSWTTTADAGAVLTTVGTALQSLGYTVTPNADGWSGVQPDTTVAQIAPAMSGIGGGALGMSKAKKEMASIAETVHGALAANGQLAQIDSQFLPPAPGAPPQG